MPYKAEDNEHVMMPLDIVVVGSDGLFDNLYTSDLLTCLYPRLDMKTGILEDLEGSAKCMAEMAEIKGNDRRYLSPFARGAHDAGRQYVGGKPDDITVIVSQVQFKYE